MRLMALLMLTLLGCESLQKEEKLQVYYDLEDLLETQIEYLGSTKPGLVKEVQLDGAADSKTMKADDIDWKEELEVFSEVNINTPALVGAFVEVSGEKDMLTYSRKQQDADGVIQFSVQFYQGTTLPRSVQINTRTENSLYNSERLLNLHFLQQNGQAVIESYRVMGNQSILGQDPTAYSLEGKLVY